MWRLQVMANGVDNTEQYDLLVDMGCTAFQGEFFGPAAEHSHFPDNSY
jgi:EAL domain-containing protein (putative c-di-GMP-specific phosphodiesterase class I)